MYNEKSNKIRWIAVITAFVLILAGVITSLAIAIQNKPVEAKANDTVSDVIEQPAESPSDNENPGLVSLRMSPSYAVAAANGQQTVSKKITATVMPVDAPDKSVDWSIKWCTPIEGKDISEYLTLTPESDGSLTATITALKGFESGSAYVTATTRVGGFTATCLIMYDGKPESLQKFNYFVTFTYDGKKHNELSFRKKLTWTLANFSHRKGWKYVGVWERSPEKKRLHFHGIFYIPDNTLPGEMIEVNDYSLKTHKRQITIQNTYFNEKFGRSDFEKIDDERKMGDAISSVNSSM